MDRREFVVCGSGAALALGASAWAAAGSRTGTGAGRLPGALVDHTDLPPDIVRHFVRHGITIMPPFRKTEISDAELDALAGYLSRNTR
jgi:mono/diheme cytochrome c family protein